MPAFLGGGNHRADRPQGIVEVKQQGEGRRAVMGNAHK
jgi:hypothetical protein